MKLIVMALLTVLSVSAFAECMCSRSSSNGSGSISSTYGSENRYYPNRLNYVGSSSVCRINRDPNGEYIFGYRPDPSCSQQAKVKATQ